ncbi:hypothetical protein D3C75_1077780 [compost metagenome]
MNRSRIGALKETGCPSANQVSIDLLVTLLENKDTTWLHLLGAVLMTIEKRGAAQVTVHIGRHQ